MDFDTENIEVKYTTDYNIFKFFKKNREVNLNSMKRKELYNSIKERGVLQPIIVDSEYRIADGQHRLAICQELQQKEHITIKIPYIVLDWIQEEDIIRLNVTSSNWTISDYVASLAKVNPTYEKLKYMANQYNLNEVLLAGLLTGTLNNVTSRNNDFKKGILTVKDSNWGIVKEFLIFLHKFSGGKKLNNIFIMALFKIWTLQIINEKRLLKLSEKIIYEVKTLPSNNRVHIEQKIFEEYNNKLSKASRIDIVQIPTARLGGRASYILNIIGDKSASRFPNSYNYFQYNKE